jgi:hypothetical protein
LRLYRIDDRMVNEHEAVDAMRTGENLPQCRNPGCRSGTLGTAHQSCGRAGMAVRKNVYLDTSVEITVALISTGTFDSVFYQNTVFLPHS